MTFGTSVASMRNGWKCTTVPRTSAKNSMSTPMCSLQHLRPAGLVYGCTRYWNSWILYYDTVSVLYVHRPNRADVTHLGEFTNELRPGQYIAEFWSGEPKNYGYRCNDDKTECKVKGHFLNVGGMAQNSIMRCCVKTPWTNFSILWTHHAKRAFFKRVKSSANPNSMNFVPNPPTKTINSSSTNGYFDRGLP